MKINKERIEEYKKHLSDVRSALKEIDIDLKVSVGIVYPNADEENGEVGFVVDQPVESNFKREVEKLFEAKFEDFKYVLRGMAEGGLQLQGGDHCGYSSSNRSPRPGIVSGISTGTIGACFEAEIDEEPTVTRRFLITASHVVNPAGRAPANPKNIWVCTDPGLPTGGFDIATLAKYTDVTGTVVTADAAIAILTEGSEADDRAIRNVYSPTTEVFESYVSVDRITNPKDLLYDRESLLGVNVIMRGCRSPETKYGVIVATDFDADIEHQLYPCQLRIEERTSNRNLFSESGDSGALIINEETRKPVGLLVGGRAYYQGGVRRYESYANPIQTVLSELKLSRI